MKKIKQVVTSLDVYNSYPLFKDHMDKMEGLLVDLTNHINCAKSELHADDVLCAGCYKSLDAAKEWLDKNKPGWDTNDEATK